MTNQLITGHVVTAAEYDADVSRFSALVSAIRTSTATGNGTTFAAASDILASALSFTADGTSNYLVRVRAAGWSSTGTGDQKVLYASLDGAAAGIIGEANTPTGGYVEPLAVDGVLLAPSAGTHTLNVRVGTASGATATIQGGSGGAGFSPILVAVCVI